MACDDPARRQALAKALNTCFVFIGSLAVSFVGLDCWFKTIGPGRSCDLRPKFWLIVPSRAPLCANIAHPDITGTRRPIANSIIFCRFWINKPSAKTTPARLAATNKCLA